MSGTRFSSKDFRLRQELNYWRERCKRIYDDSSVHRLIHCFMINGIQSSKLVIAALRTELENCVDRRRACFKILTQCASKHCYCLEYLLQHAAKEKFHFYGESYTASNTNRCVSKKSETRGFYHSFGLSQELKFWRERCSRIYRDSSAHRLIHHFQIKGFDESALVVGAIQSELEDNMDKKSGCRRILSECAVVNCLEYVLQMAAKEKFDFYGVWDTKSPNCGLVSGALFLGMYGEFRMLVRYGFSTEATENMGTSEPTTTSSLNKMSTRLVYKTMWHLLFAKEKGLMKAGKGIFLSFLLLSRTTTSIPISVQELAEYSQRVQKSKYSIYHICSAYMDLYPSLSLRPNTPHSLQHLSRCKVRRCLGEAKRLPGGIQELNIPVNFKRYLDLQF